MSKILDFLLKNPFYLFVLLAWLVPVIGNILKKAEKARRSGAPSPSPSRPAEQAQLPAQSQRTLPQQTQAQSGAQSMPPVAQRSPQPLAGPTKVAQPRAAQPVSAKNAEDVAREMRRILGLDPQPVTPPPPPRRASQTLTPPPRRAPVAPQIEPPPQQVQLSMRDRKLELQVESHVGEQMRDRHLGGPRRRQKRGAQRIGNLGGRAVERAAHQRAGSRFALDDLKRAIVLSEILAPPVALRPFEERRGH